MPYNILNTGEDDMDYKSLPIFKGITPATELYLNQFDIELQKNNIKLAPEDILIRKADLFYDYLSSIRDVQSGAKSQNQINQNLNKRLAFLSNPKGNVSLWMLMKSIYGYRRKVENTPKFSAYEYSQCIQQWRKVQNGLSVSTGQKIEGQEVATGWIYKESPQYRLNKKAGKPLHRFILNVDPSKELLDKLDKFALKYACQYKCAEDMQEAYNRPDTIVIYTADERIHEQQDELKKLVAPCVRQNGNELLDGVRISDGLYTSPEPQRELIEQLEKRARVVYPRLADLLKGELDNNKKLSLGEFTIYQQICDSVAIEKGMHNTPQRLTYNSDDIKVKEELAKGIVFQDKDKKVRVSVEDGKIIHIQIKDKEGKPFLDFEIDKETKQYVAKNMQSGNIYSNDVLFKKHPFYKGELPDYIGRACHNFYQKAKNIVRSNIGISVDRQRQ